MEENLSPELSLAPEPEQSQEQMDSCYQGFVEEDVEQKETQIENVVSEAIAEPSKSVKGNSEVKKTWGFRRSTVAKREMPVEAAIDGTDSRCPVRRSGRQPKRTDKLEEFLSTAKRASRRSAPPSLESGDPPSQTPTDAETASEASFDGNADPKAVEEKPESPERRTRSGTRKQPQRKTRSGRVTRAGGGDAVKDEGSSENEEENKEQLQEKINHGAQPESVGMSDPAQPQPEQVSDKNQHGGNDKEETEKDTDGDTDKDTDEDGVERSAAMMVKRGPIRTYINKMRAANKSTSPSKAPPPANKSATPVKRETKPQAAPCQGKLLKQETPEDDDYEDDDEDDDDESTTSSSSSSIESEEGGYDPNALYCICRQKHNKRFMICCDRCEEWFHGDCVGITEARGRLMERNGEDYICPNCTAKKNQVVRPAMSNLYPEIGKARVDAALLNSVTSTATTVTSGVNQLTGAAAPPSSSSAGTEEKISEDVGIKGRIEKATNPTGKKRIKIFQPQVMQQPAGPKAGQKSAPNVEKKAVPTAERKTPQDSEQKVASNVEVNTSTAEEKGEKVGQTAVEDSSLPKCIGPGCENNAQPDSVYCGNDCILRHAAAAMKSITEEPNQKEKEKAKAAKTKSSPKKSSTGGKKTQKKNQEESDSEGEQSTNPDEDDEDEHAEEHRPSPSTASWSSDHNYIAVTPEKTTPISPTVLNKKSPPKEEKQSEKEHKEKDPASAPEKPQQDSTTQAKRNKKIPTTKAAKVSPKGKKASLPPSTSKASKKPMTPPSKTTTRSKKSSSSPSPSPFPRGPIHVTGALRATSKSNFTIPKKPPQKDASSRSQPSSSSRVPSSPASSGPSHHSSSRPPHPVASAPPVSPMPPPPNNQMRQNIRRSLTDIIFKRVSDSDDLKMTESEVGRLAVAIEKEMFNICLSTDSKYKNKYRSLMFNLKDPKNKGLFYRVVGGEVSPFRLVRLSAEELLSKEISEWRKPDAHQVNLPGSRGHSMPSKLGNRQDSGSNSMDLEDAPPTSDADVCISTNTSSTRLASAADQDESGSNPSATTQPSAMDGNSGNSMPDIFSNMLKDTTSEHRTHLFDLNCKICTGQRTEDEPAAKKAKLIKKPETKPLRQEMHSTKIGETSPTYGQPQIATVYQQQDPLVYQQPIPPSYQSNIEPAASESQPHYPEDIQSIQAPPAQTPAPLPPTVSSVSITRRDPRMARHSSGVTVNYTAPEKAVVNTAEPLPAPASAPAEVVPKTSLPMPPSLPPSGALSKPSKTSSSETPPEGETAIFLHGQEKIWKGFINMQSVAKFVTKAYLVSGSFEHLKEDLPDTIHVGGRISPNTVWDYVGKLKTSLSKELCLIRFHPATEEEEVAYVSLFSYFSSRKRFGVVANNNRRIKDLYLIPLGSKDPLPSKLLPFDGPGLEPARPNLLLGLLICQKDRKRAGAPLETEEKRSKTQTKDVDEAVLQKTSAAGRGDRSTRSSLEISFSTTPPGSPPDNSSETSTNTVTAPPVLSFLSSLKASASSITAGKDSPPTSSPVAPSAATATPLQTILNTLFPKKKHDSASNSPSEHGGELSISASSILDPIVRQYAQSSHEKQIEEDEDDRPYDPEEEYEPSSGYNVPNKPVLSESKPDISKQTEMDTNSGDDVAYDPEDDSIFEDVKPLVPDQVKVAAESIPDPQKILESLKQIGDQTLQKRGEQQLLAIGIPPADKLLTKPTKSILASTQLLQLGKQVEELVKTSSVAPLINQKRDPRQSRDPRQAVTDRKLSEEADDKEETPAELSDSTPPSEPVIQEPEKSNASETQGSSQEPEAPVPKEEVKSELLPFMESDETEVSIPLLGEEVEPDMEVNYLEEKEVKCKEPVEAETEMDKYSIWPNAASILKVGEDSEYEENSQDTPFTSYCNEPANNSTVTSTIPVLNQSSSMGDAQSRHMSHHMLVSGFDKEYRPPTDIPRPSNFPPPHLMQGQNLIMRPPPVSIPPPMQGLPPMSGPLPLQGPPLPIHVPPPVRGPSPIQGGSSQQYGSAPAAYPPYQNQWLGNQPQQQQQQPPPQQQQHPPGQIPQNIMPPRGPLQFPPMSQRAQAPQMFDQSIPPQHIRQQGPPPGLPQPPAFDGQKNLPPPRFTGPPPPFNFPAARVPPPPFTGPPPGHFDRLPPPSHFSGPRGPPPSQYAEHGAPLPIGDQLRGHPDHYNKDNSNVFKANVDQNPIPLHIFQDNQGLPPSSAYRGPPPSQYEDRRGPPSGGDISGPNFSPHNQYGNSRPQSSPPHRGSFEDPRGPPPHENRPHPSLRFGGSERYRLDRHSDEPRHVRHGGPLLPTPPEAPLGPQSRIGVPSPDLHREDLWRRHSPEIRRRSSTNTEDFEPRSGDRFSRFDVVHRELGLGPSQPPEERLREQSEDRRRDREREVPHPGRPSWDRRDSKRWSRERDWDRAKERDRDQERGKERDRDHERSKERDRDQERSGEKERDQERSREKDRDQERSREKDRDQERSRERDRDQDRSREKDRDHERSRERDRDQDRSREKERDQERGREKDRDQERGRERDRDQERGREKDRDQERGRERDRGEERSREKDRDQERSREKERDQERNRERDRDQERNREKDRDQERNRERDRDQERNREKDRDQERNKERDRDQERNKERDRDQERNKERDRDQERNKERDQSRGREGERHRETEGERRDQDTDKRRDRDRDKERDRPRDSDRDRARNRDRERDRDRDRERDKKRDRSRSRERDRDKDRGKERGKDRDRERDKDKDRDKERDRRGRSRSREKREDKKESKADQSKESDKTAENAKTVS